MRSAEISMRPRSLRAGLLAGPVFTRAGVGELTAPGQDFGSRGHGARRGVGPQRCMMERSAVVIGGSVAGLLATRALVDHFGRVTLLERDAFPTTATQRRGVPQGAHVHGLLASGRRVLDQLFPGLASELIGAGAIAGDIVRDSRFFVEGACLARPASGLEGLLSSRPFLEAALRRRVLSLPNVILR